MEKESSKPKKMDVDIDRLTKHVNFITTALMVLSVIAVIVAVYVSIDNSIVTVIDEPTYAELLDGKQLTSHRGFELDAWPLLWTLAAIIPVFMSCAALHLLVRIEENTRR